MKKSIILIVMDGLGDRPAEVLRGRTPLESAYTPNMNHMARHGISGLLYPVDYGIVCGSDTSHLSLLGYKPEEVYTGRGPFEAMGLGMEVHSGDVAFRANYATREGEIITDRRAGRIEEKTDELSNSLSMKIDDIQINVRSGVEHRAALVMHGPGLSGEISDSDPHEVVRPVRAIHAMNEKSEKTARIINEFLERSRKILDSSPMNIRRKSEGKPPANELLLRGAGQAPFLPAFGEKYGMKGAYIIGIPMIRGIAEMIGLEKIDVPGITGGKNTNYVGKLKSARENSAKYEFILMNIKAPDAAAHDMDPAGKVEVMERIDEAMENLIGIEDRALVIITGDHSTSSTTGEHTGDPVPVTFYTGSSRSIGAGGFNERECSRTGFSLKSGSLMTYALQITDRLEKYGA
jgi:2,3-bisphosphoglycerate-independent phosphoglycerate mutase